MMAELDNSFTDYNFIANKSFADPIGSIASSETLHFYFQDNKNSCSARSIWIGNCSPLFWPMKFVFFGPMCSINFINAAPKLSLQQLTHLITSERHSTSAMRYFHIPHVSFGLSINVTSHRKNQHRYTYGMLFLCRTNNTHQIYGYSKKLRQVQFKTYVTL